MFFHGIAPGLWIYLPFLTRFGGQRACIYVEVEHITTTLSFEASRWNVMVQAVEEVMQRHGIQGMCVSGHSFGSIVAGWMAKALHDKVKQLVLIDPVCLLLW